MTNAKVYEYITGGRITIDSDGRILFTDLNYSFPYGENIYKICETRKIKFNSNFKEVK
jgi:hypothetical protein